MKIKYFIRYTTKDGEGRTGVELDKPITSTDDIDAIESYISRDGIQRVVLGWKRFEQE
jgi:hypothetical protein